MYGFPQESSSKMLKIIGELVGDEPNLKIDFQALKFNLGNMKYTLNGEVNLNVIRLKDLERVGESVEKRIVSR
jgi:hypothetical protein